MFLELCVGIIREKRAKQFTFKSCAVTIQYFALR